MTEAPDSASLADAAGRWKSAYVHIPFCHRRCPYCDFAVVAEGESATPPAAYMEALDAEIDLERSWDRLDAVNFGGGTPTAVEPGYLVALIDHLERRWGFATGIEVSVEANPEDWTDEMGTALLEAGVTRLSLGVQSFDGAVLEALGRSHTPAQATAAVAGAIDAGFESVSVDLIYGTPGESLASWEQGVGAAIDLGIDHLSAYALTVERGTQLAREVLAGAAAPDPDDQADKYERLTELAAAAGLVRYEVSNFARPGHPCRYNLSTWAQGEYLGFGLGAHDHVAGTRSRNVRRLDRYLEAIEHGVRPRAGTETVRGWNREQERLVLGLRRAAGVATGSGGRALLDSDDGERLVAAGILHVGENRIVVARPLLTDAASRAVLSLSPREC